MIGKTNSSNGTKIIALGAGTKSGSDVVFNIKALLPKVNYAKLTNANFIPKINYCSMSAYTNGGNVIVGSISTNCSPTHSYNASTGILTISGLNGHTSTTSGGYTTQSFIAATVGNCYLVLGDIDTV